MSWRRFLTLLAGLSGESRWQHALAADRDTTTTPLEGAAGQVYFDQLAAGGPA